MCLVGCQKSGTNLSSSAVRRRSARGDNSIFSTPLRITERSATVASFLWTRTIRKRRRGEGILTGKIWAAPRDPHLDKKEVLLFTGFFRQFIDNYELAGYHARF
jgi:hypothetical protein